MTTPSESAFPAHTSINQTGMTLREYAAIKIMAVMCGDPERWDAAARHSNRTVQGLAIQAADALLKELGD